MSAPTVTAIDSRTWCLDEGGVRFFLLAGNEKALLVDSGMHTHDARDVAAGLTDLPLSLFNTHCDVGIIDLGGRELEAIALPGHTSGSMALLDQSSGMLFSGDPLQRDGRIFMFGPMRSVAAYIHGLKRLRTRANEITSIWPCHATCPIGVEVIDELIAGAEAVERGEVPYTDAEMHGTPIREYDVGVSTLLCDPA